MKRLFSTRRVTATDLFWLLFAYTEAAKWRLSFRYFQSPYFMLYSFDSFSKIANVCDILFKCISFIKCRTNIHINNNYTISISNDSIHLWIIRFQIALHFELKSISWAISSHRIDLSHNTQVYWCMKLFC